MKKILLFVWAWTMFLFPAFVFAQAVPGPAPSVISLPNPLSSETFEQLIEVVINWLLVIALPIVVLLIVYAGAQILTSGVINPKQREEAKKVIFSALGGYVVILLAKVFVGVIKGLFS